MNFFQKIPDNLNCKHIRGFYRVTKKWVPHYSETNLNKIKAPLQRFNVESRRIFVKHVLIKGKLMGECAVFIGDMDCKQGKK